MFNSLQSFTPPLGYRIGFYVRSASGNLDHIREQQNELKTFIENLNGQFKFAKNEKSFIDPNHSGMSPKRPGLDQLLRAVGKKEIDLIIVTDLMRLSRSSLLFNDLLHFCFLKNCNFLSLRESFHLFENEELKGLFENDKFHLNLGEASHA
jgi:DNA invertase Pin-like site-specific DNA recombinase